MFCAPPFVYMCEVFLFVGLFFCLCACAQRCLPKFRLSVANLWIASGQCSVALNKYTDTYATVGAGRGRRFRVNPSPAPPRARQKKKTQWVSVVSPLIYASPNLCINVSTFSVRIFSRRLYVVLSDLFSYLKLKVACFFGMKELLDRVSTYMHPRHRRAAPRSLRNLQRILHFICFEEFFYCIFPSPYIYSPRNFPYSFYAAKQTSIPNTPAFIMYFLCSLCSRELINKWAKLREMHF